MKNILVSSLCALTLTTTNAVYAEVNSTPTQINSAVTEAYDLLEILNMDTIYTQMIDKALSAQSEMLPQKLRDDKEMYKEFQNIMNKFMHKYLSWDKVKEDMAKLYAKHYTASELKDIKTFYLTPTGQKALNIMPQVMMESIQLSQSKILPHMGEMQQEIMKLIKSKEKKDEVQ